jgi:hypothetical protein
MNLRILNFRNVNPLLGYFAVFIPFSFFVPRNCNPQRQFVTLQRSSSYLQVSLQLEIGFYREGHSSSFLSRFEVGRVSEEFFQSLD